MVNKQSTISIQHSVFIVLCFGFLFFVRKDIESLNLGPVGLVGLVGQVGFHLEPFEPLELLESRTCGKHLEQFEHLELLEQFEPLDKNSGTVSNAKR